MAAPRTGHVKVRVRIYTRLCDPCRHLYRDIKSLDTIGPVPGNMETKARAPHQMQAGGSGFFLSLISYENLYNLTNAPPAPAVRPTVDSMGEEMVRHYYN